jgi:hypothetical protein
MQFLCNSYAIPMPMQCQCNANAIPMQSNAIQCNSMQFNAINAIPRSVPRRGSSRFVAALQGLLLVAVRRSVSVQSSGIKFVGLFLVAVRRGSSQRFLQYNAIPGSVPRRGSSRFVAALQFNAIQCNSMQSNAIQCNPVHFQCISNAIQCNPTHFQWNSMQFYAKE